jgi:hypothetical protein
MLAVCDVEPRRARQSLDESHLGYNRTGLPHPSTPRAGQCFAWHRCPTSHCGADTGGSWCCVVGTRRPQRKARAGVTEKARDALRKSSSSPSGGRLLGLGIRSGARKTPTAQRTKQTNHNKTDKSRGSRTPSGARTGDPEGPKMTGGTPCSLEPSQGLAKSAFWLLDRHARPRRTSPTASSDRLTSPKASARGDEGRGSGRQLECEMCGFRTGLTLWLHEFADGPMPVLTVPAHG